MEIDLSEILCGDGVENGRVTRPIPRKGMETIKIPKIINK
jgi:hypothetical protein